MQLTYHSNYNRCQCPRRLHCSYALSSGALLGGSRTTNPDWICDADVACLALLISIIADLFARIFLWYTVISFSWIDLYILEILQSILYLLLSLSFRPVWCIPVSTESVFLIFDLVLSKWVPKKWKGWTPRLLVRRLDCSGLRRERSSEVVCGDIGLKISVYWLDAVNQN